jgi:PAS domain S-box-containing protein
MSRPFNAGSDRSFLLVAALLCVITVCLAALTSFGYETLSAVRAYVYGEGRWAKAQKDAVHDLIVYDITRDEQSYRAFVEDLQVPLGDHRARLELEKPNPQLAAVTESFVAGANDPRDVPEMIRLYRRFRHVSYMERAVRAWEAGDAGIDQLLAAGARMHASAPSAGAISRSDLEELDRLNEQLTARENEFSTALGEASRWVHGLLTTVTTVTAVSLALIALLVLRVSMQGIHRSETQLRESERRFSALIQNSNDGVSILDEGRRLRFLSAAGERILGVGADIAEVAHPDDRGVLSGAWTATVESPGKPQPFTLRVRNAETGWRVLDCVFVNQFGDPAIRGMVCNFRDVTDRKMMEAHLTAADRMASVGLLASGIAHEINNPLAYAIGNLDLLREDLRPAEGSEVANGLRDTHEGLLRVSEIVRGLRTFARSGDERLAPLDLRLVLDSAIEVASHEVRQRAQLYKEYAPDLPAVLGNEAKLGQVFLNLLINAAHAFEKGKRAGNEIHVRASAVNGHVVVELKDTGAGIPLEHREHIFDPFFTTKAIGEGKGLGLFVCRNIVTAQGGDITFDSEPGKGTTFWVSLPAAPAAAAAT